VTLFDLQAPDPNLGFQIAVICVVVAIVIVFLNHLPPPDRGVLV
jgi:hypothetical protein